MTRSLLLIAFSLFVLSGTAQTRIDSSFAFQTNPAKKYSVYIPTAYSPSAPNVLMVAFHPLNVGVWDAKAWCDTLKVFAEMNDLLLVCPDGGANGDITDPIDYDFTTALIDSMKLWYNVDIDRIYAMGFSVGGVATYEYGFNHSAIFGGFMPIGAAVSGPGAFPGIIANAEGKPYFLIHGGNDSPASRYTPMLNGLDTNCVIVSSILMPGIGHTINFPNRNQILSDAYDWIDSVNTRPDTVDVPFIPITPVNGTNIIVQGFKTQKVIFSWTRPAFAPACTEFELIMDKQSGDFSSPIYTIVPGDGTDTTITLTYHILDSLMNDQGVVPGDFLSVKWAVAARFYGRFLDTTKVQIMAWKHEKIGFSLLSPANNHTFNLTNGSSLFFDWQDLPGSGITYELLFDTINGDFSNPVFTYQSSTSGTSSSLTKTHSEVYYDMLFEKNYAVGDTLHLIWTAKASNGSISEFASGSRKVNFRRGNVGFELISPADKVLITSRVGITTLFMWDSVPLPNITYKIVVDSLNGNFTNALSEFPSNNSGQAPRLDVTFETLDSILNVFNIAYGDTLHGKWSVKATSPGGDFFAFMPYDIDIFRDFPKGIEDHNITKRITVYPNPAIDHVIIPANEQHQLPKEIYLYSSAGQLIKSYSGFESGTGSISVNLEGIPSGNYLLLIGYANDMVYSQIVIK